MSKHALEITDSNFNEVVLKSSVPVMIDFWAEWCGPCKMISPIVEDLAKQYSGKALIGKVDVSSNADVSSKYEVKFIPTILFIKDGKVVDKQVGAVSKADLVKKLEAIL